MDIIERNEDEDRVQRDQMV